ncbi:hypothetical protein Vadar_025301 [Vaccinium darrowii]|uniref:Uncharacterized protein n=1 Tax=Vaccinium darrowii TaxID=229202 RepID=A0ACB7YI47_9ERIC|nr:hypothetical protein Vadar_025301 [Vaccinium darrowii]
MGKRSTEEALDFEYEIENNFSIHSGTDFLEWEDDESSSILNRLDENGFPPSQHPSELKDDDDIELDTNQSNEIEQESEEGTHTSFAADFYRCGSDYSSLLLVSEEEKKDNQKKQNMPDPKLMRKLKQTNLFQMWGVHTKSDQRPQLDCNGSNSNKKMKGLLSDGSLDDFGLESNIAHDNVNNGFLHIRNSSGIASSSGGVADRQRPRVCPFYKKIPGTPFTVDAFRYGRIEGCKAYILSHFHADHYGGLSKGWSHGPIYCTTLTARLVRLCLYVNPTFIHPLELGIEYLIEGIKVTMLEANHCPGAALIHFCLPNGRCYLHTGDFRASKLMHTYPLLVNQRVNVLYLDTTYCNPKYRFPSKEDVLSFVVRVTQNFLRKQPKSLIIVGAYSIGKECVYLAISKALGVKIYANSSRKRILQSFGWPELSGNLCSNGKETPLHVLPISSLKFEALEHYSKTYMNQYTAVLAFRPTGWTYSEAIGSHLDLIKPTSRGKVTIYGVPYSEHSSFTELREFVQFIRPDKIIPTVNIGNAATRDKMQSHFREWMR